MTTHARGGLYRLAFLSILAVLLVVGSGCDDDGDSTAMPGDGMTAVVPTGGAATTPSPGMQPTMSMPTPASTGVGSVATVGPAIAAERDGTDGFRAFAQQVQAAFDRHDTGFVTQRMAGTSAICTADELGRKGPAGGPLCPSVGATFLGFPSAAWPSR